MKPSSFHAARDSVSGAAGVLALLEEDDDGLKLYALQQLDSSVHDFWFQISGSIALIESLYEDEDFTHRELAALVASKVCELFWNNRGELNCRPRCTGSETRLLLVQVFYHLDDLDEALAYALGASTLFDVSSSSDYVRTILSTCLDTYISARAHVVDFKSDAAADDIDARLVAIVERLFDRCMADGQAEQAVGIAIECRRLDRLESAIMGGRQPEQTLAYALAVAQQTVESRSFRDDILRLIVDLYERMPSPDHGAVCKCLTTLGDAEQVAAIFVRLLQGNDEDALVAYQIGFDMFESELVSFIAIVREKLSAAKPVVPKTKARSGEGAGEGEAMAVDAVESSGVTASVEQTTAVAQRFSRFDSIVSGEVPIELERRFLALRNAADLQILRNIKLGIEPRNSVCHGATVFANAVMHAGTCVDTFLRENLDWLAKATNWAKFSATAGMGAIHRGNLSHGRRVLSPYLPPAPGGSTSSAYSEGGALYALGLIHANRGADIRGLLLNSLRGAQHEVVQHGACLGLGLAGLGSEDAEAFEEVKNVLYTDSAVAGEAAGVALGLLFAGTGAERSAEMLAYAHDTQHEKIIRGLSIGLAVVQYGREEAAETHIEAMTQDQDPILRYGGMFALGLAYRGTGNNTAVARLLHFAVSDVSDDVRRAAVMNLGFVLASSPEQCARTVTLLAESYNPHVRYGAAMAVGIAAAGTGSREATMLLEPMLRDSIDFVQQGALIASALVLMEQPENRQKALRARISSLHGNRGAELMARMGSIMAAGILDAGGRNATLGLRSEGGHFRRSAVVGLALFTQYWYWYPLSYAVCLALAPTALIGVDATLGAPKDFAAVCTAKPSAFAYPPPVSTEDKKSKDKIPTAVLSTTARAKARAAKKEKKESTDAMDIEKTEPTEGTASRDEKPQHPKSKEPEPSNFTLENPARVVAGQRRFVQFQPNQRWQPVRPVPSGFVVLRDSTPGEAVEYMFKEEQERVDATKKEDAESQGPSAAAPAAPQGDEPPPPEPFEYVPS